jgi:hypothetical protein
MLMQGNAMSVLHDAADATLPRQAVAWARLPGGKSIVNCTSEGETRRGRFGLHETFPGEMNAALRRRRFADRAIPLLRHI